MLTYPLCFLYSRWVDEVAQPYHKLHKYFNKCVSSKFKALQKNFEWNTCIHMWFICLQYKCDMKYWWGLVIIRIIWMMQLVWKVSGEVPFYIQYHHDTCISPLRFWTHQGPHPGLAVWCLLSHSVYQGWLYAFVPDNTLQTIVQAITSEQLFVFL